MQMEGVEVNSLSLSDFYVIGTLGFMGLMGILVGGSLAIGVTAGIGAAGFGGILLYKTRVHAPKAWNTMMDHPIATDVLLSATFIVGAGMTLGGIIVGITAAGATTVGVTLASKYIGKVEGIPSYSLNFARNKAIKVDDHNYIEIRR